jgi:DNA-binding IclR family transcriptional regulator
MAVDGTPVATVEAVQKIMERVAEKKAEVVVLKVRRGIRTLFVELQSTWTTEAVGR